MLSVWQNVSTTTHSSKYTCLLPKWSLKICFVVILKEFKFVLNLFENSRHQIVLRSFEKDLDKLWNGLTCKEKGNKI